MSDYEMDDRPMPLFNGSAFCFYCGKKAHRQDDGKWMCEEHYDEKVRSKYRKIHNPNIEVVEE